MSEIKPVIVVTRHPDFSDEISVHGVEADVVYIDLGSSFDRTPDDEDQAREWAQSIWDDVKDLPDGHPARDEVLNVISTTVEDYFDVNELAVVLGRS